jgi:hypothetical protein
MRNRQIAHGWVRGAAKNTFPADRVYVATGFLASGVLTAGIQYSHSRVSLVFGSDANYITWIPLAITAKENGASNSNLDWDLGITQILPSAASGQGKHLPKGIVSPPTFDYFAAILCALPARVFMCCPCGHAFHFAIFLAR